MKDVVEALRKSKKVFLGSKADVHHNIDARKYLAEEGMAVFPDEFFSLVKYINGMRDDTAQIYGILPEGSDLGLEDAVRENERFDRADKSSVSVLGSTIFDYLVYDGTSHQYQLRDRETDAISETFSSLPQALHRIFKI